MNAPSIELHTGPRDELRALFELAEDSKSELAGYMALGEVLVARLGPRIVGHLQLVVTNEGHSVEIKNMAVDAGHQGEGIGRALVEAALDRARGQRCRLVLVATGAADVGNLRFYQRLGFRMSRIERDAFTAARGYPTPIDVDGIELRDRVWFDREP